MPISFIGKKKGDNKKADKKKTDKKNIGKKNNYNQKKNNVKQRKANIPRALKEQVWIKNIGKKFEHKCYISWCKNMMNVFDFHVGHNIPESKGGKLNISNLKPICSRCNYSMSNNYTISEWNKLDKNGNSKNGNSKNGNSKNGNSKNGKGYRKIVKSGKGNNSETGGNSGTSGNSGIGGNKKILANDTKNCASRAVELLFKIGGKG